MNRLVQILAFALLGVWMVTPIRAEDAKPFVLEKFFAGDLVAEGNFTNLWTGEKRGMTVAMKGRWDGVTLTLKEDFVYSDGEQAQKTWVFTKLGEGRYAGEREDVVGEATVAKAEDDITLAYTAKIGGVNLDFKDRLTRVDPLTVHNTADVYFLGFIKIGTVDLTIKRNKAK
jgi:hypothetical protein